jgi:hypothetical protein
VSTLLGNNLQKSLFLSAMIVVKWVTFVLNVIALGLGSLRERFPTVPPSIDQVELVLMVKDLVLDPTLNKYATKTLSDSHIRAIHRTLEQMVNSITKFVSCCSNVSECPSERARTKKHQLLQN